MCNGNCNGCGNNFNNNINNIVFGTPKSINTGDINYIALKDKPLNVQLNNSNTLAIEWTGYNFIEIDKFITDYHETFPSDGYVYIQNSSGSQIVSINDWVVKDECNGEFYAYTSDEFMSKYKVVL